MISTGKDHLFKNVDFDPQLYEEAMKKPAARTNYVIYFTPRSGSSWLTDILVQTKRMSRANEAFNPNFIPRIVRAVNASNLDQYVNVIKRRHNNHGIYGFEITWHQLNAIFPKHDQFIEYFGTSPAFWLVRRDIVAQAVSLAKMVTTKVAHAPHSTENDRKVAELVFSYDSALIKQWLLHILAAERGTEILFAKHCVNPLRICYEDMMSTGAEEIARIMMEHVGAKRLPEMTFNTRHEKLGTTQNQEYADRFREQARNFLCEVEEERAVWLNKLVNLSSFA